MTPILILALLSAAPASDGIAPTAQGGSTVDAPHAAEVQPPSLEQILRALADEERKGGATTDCRFKEHSRVEELKDDDTVKGAITRVWAMTRSKGATSRKVLSTEKQGDLNAMFTQEPKEPSAEEKKQQHSPFHPEVQQKYRFKLLAADAKALKLSFEPLDRSDKRMSGTATVDPVKLTLTSMSAVPSKMPPMVERLALELRYASTACGVQPVHIRVKGAGGFLFFKTRFRSETRHEGHAPLSP